MNYEQAVYRKCLNRHLFHEQGISKRMLRDAWGSHSRSVLRRDDPSINRNLML